MPDPRALAERIVSTIAPPVREQLSRDPFRALESLGFEVRMRAEATITGGCSVAATLDHGPPPKITIVAAASVGRQRFSTLHEFGHALIRADTEIHDVFFEQPDGGTQLEEDVCDAIAATLLIPADHVNECLGNEGPTARTVLDLIESSPGASREACCVRAAERISGPGHVMVLRDCIALFTASHSTPFRVRRNTPQAPDHLAARAAGLGTARGHAPVTYASGVTSDSFFMDAVYDPAKDVVIAVFMENRPPWEQGLALPPERATGAADACCTRCEVDFEGFGRTCPSCGDYYHRGDDGCGRCSCPDAAPRSKVCSECFLRRPASNFNASPEICDICVGL